MSARTSECLAVETSEERDCQSERLVLETAEERDDSLRCRRCSLAAEAHGEIEAMLQQTSTRLYMQ